MRNPIHVETIDDALGIGDAERQGPMERGTRRERCERSMNETVDMIPREQIHDARTRLIAELAR